MTEFIAANIAPLMFAAMVAFLLFGYPVAFALAANGIVFGLVGIELGLLDASLFQALPQRVWAVMSNEGAGSTSGSDVALVTSTRARGSRLRR